MTNLQASINSRFFLERWWGGSTSSSAYTDLHHIYPSDGYVNGVRANYPIGGVTSTGIIYESSNKSKLGRCVDPDSSTCFEPFDHIKGQFARTYFYMSVRYYKIFTCCNVPQADAWKLKPWTVQTLKQWHRTYVARQTEKNRNDRIFGIQGNRNPFIDNPDWINKIW